MARIFSKMAIFFGCAGVFFWVLQHPFQSKNMDVVSLNQASVESESIAAANVEKSNDQTDSKLINENGKNIFYQRLALEVNERQKNHVIGVDRENTDYANYSDAVLTEMADSGDVLAIKILALRYAEYAKQIKDSDEYFVARKKVQNMYDKAIVYGDTEFLGFMSGLRDAESRISDPRLTPEQKHQTAIEILAHMEFKGLRGALNQKYTDQIMAFDIYKDFGFPEKLTENDKSMVRERAKEIYDEYERKRLDLGLGPYDNSIPEEIAKGYERDRKEYELKMGDNAI